MRYDEVYQQLNREQQKAVDTLDGPVMVLAGPGTGKTQLLAIRTANILRKTDLYPSNILVLTYTNAGVKAMRDRLAEIMGPNGYEVVVETFHGFANHLISESEEAISIRGDRKQITDLERISLLEYLLDHLSDIGALRHPNAPYYYRSAIEKTVSALKREGVTPEGLADFLRSNKDNKKLEALLKIYAAYEEAKTREGNVPVFDQRGRYDFDDMILLATDLLENNPAFLASMREQFQYVMVDEFQDTNGAQLKFLFSVFSDPESNICVVGDDDQSIFRFQGATVENFRRFQNHFLNFEKIILTANYRSTPNILAKSKEFIDQMSPQYRVAVKNLQASRNETKPSVVCKTFSAQEEELTYLIKKIQTIPEAKRNQTAVLLRTRNEVQKIIEAFLQAGIPYVTDGKEDIRGEFRIQQLISFLKLCIDDLSFEEKDVLLFQILLFDFWGIDHQDLVLFSSWAQTNKKNEKQLKKRRAVKSTQFREQSSLLHDPIQFKPELSLFSEFIRRFPAPTRIKIKEHDPPLPEETMALPMLRTLSFNKPFAFHKASWALQKIITRASHYPVLTIVLDFLKDSGMIDFILKHYEYDRVLQLRELRAISGFVQNMQKANQAFPGIMIPQYVRDLEKLERHEIPLTGEMVSRSQEGIHVITTHGSKGLEFEQVFIPFCIQDRSWPKKPRGELIPLPFELLHDARKENTKEEEKKLHHYDELRLFYVASTRAKQKVTFTASLDEKAILSQWIKNAGMEPKAMTHIPEHEILIRVIQKIPLPDPFQNTKTILAGLIQELNLSPSSVNRYLICPRQFLYHHLLKTPQPKKPSLIYGNCIHKALERCFRRYLKEGKLPPRGYFEEQFLLELEWQGVDKSIQQSCLQKFEHAKQWYDEQQQNEVVKPLELERRLVKKMPQGLVFEGKFDKVEPAHKGTVRVVDYKTGIPDDHIKAITNCSDIFSKDCDPYLRQLIAYKMLYESGYQRRKVTDGQLVFLDPIKESVKKYNLEEGKFVAMNVPLTKEMVHQYEKLVLEVWNKIHDLQFDRLSEFDKDKCGVCPYQNVCWKASGDSDSTRSIRTKFLENRVDIPRPHQEKNRIV